MVRQLGMGKSGMIGNFQALDWYRRAGGSGGQISEELKTKLDNDVQDILKGCLDEVTELLKKEIPLLDRWLRN